MKVGIIGAGNMGSAIYRKLIDCKMIKELWITDHHVHKLQSFEKGHITSSPDELLHRVELVLLAIKPQSFDHFSLNLSNHFLISIMTGITFERINQKTGANRIIRAMPNLGLAIGKSVTGWLASPGTSFKEKTFAKALFSLFGEEMEVKEQDQLNALTALTGSGPAYFFYFSENLMNEAVSLGFSKEEARKMVLGTIEGAASLMKEDLPENLREKVTSKKGTTEAAIKVFKEGGLGELIHKAVKAAQKRAEELSQ